MHALHAIGKQQWQASKAQCMQIPGDMALWKVLGLLLPAITLATARTPETQSFTGDGTAFSDTVAQWGGDLRRFNCQFNTTSAYFSENFAAMNHPQWEDSAACGRCVEVKCVDPRCPVQNVSRVLQIVDHCGECLHGDLGMSYSAYRAVTGMHPHRLRVSWEWAECNPFMDQPNILFTPKTDGVNEYWQAFNFANLAQPLKQVAANGQNLPRTTWNNWVWTPQGGGALDLDAPLTLKLTSTSGESVTTTVNELKQQWLVVQFSKNNTKTPASDAPATLKPMTPATSSPSPATSTLPNQSSDATGCVDTPTPGYSCEKQKAWGKCGADFMLQNNWCAATCGRCNLDKPQPQESTAGNSTQDAGLPPSSTDPSPSLSPSLSPPPALSPSGPPSPSPLSGTSNTGGSALSASVAAYGKVLGLSWLFYEAQRSGKLPASNRVPWRGDSHLNDMVPGGWYDAGDHLKLNFPLATAATFLSWGVIEFADAYNKVGELQHAQEGIRWVADYLMACHQDESSYIGQIGDPGPDHAYWGRPEDQTGDRPYFVWDSSKPGSDLIGAAASALASASIVFKSADPEYAQECLHHAKQLCTLASQNEGKYSDSIPSVTYVYMSANYIDDLAFAAAWLYRATGETQYLDASQNYLKRAQYQRNYFVNWDSVFSATDNLLLSMGVEGSEEVNGDIEWQFNTFLKAWQQGQHGMKFSPKGLAVAPLGGWGNLRHSANAAFMMVLHAKYTSDQSVRSACLDFAKGQIDYMLGSTGRSYVVGYGNNPPTHPHHRAASCPDRPAECSYNTAFNNPEPNPQVLYGALVGGPNDQDVYEDKRSDYVSNEVAVDYNAGFTGALAGLVQLIDVQQ